jgi:hypothetical protein
VDIGDVFLRLLPDASGFRRETERKVKTETAGLSTSVTVKVDDRGSIRSFTSRMDSATKSTEAASSSIATLGVSAMPSLIGAGVVAAPVIATLGVGLGGLAVAAYGVVKPIETVASKAGGLQANLHKLNPEQQAAARSLLTLQRSYAGFNKALAPAVLRDFNAGLRVARTLLRGAEPVALATGRALGGLLGSVDAEFRSQTWQQFFGWMATTGVSDVRLLSGSLVNLLHTIPTLVEGVQPVTKTLLDMTSVASRLAAVASNIQQSGRGAQGATGPLATFADWTKRALLDITPFSPDLRKVWDNLAGISSSSPPATRGIRSTGSAAAFAAPSLQQIARATAALMTAEQTAVTVQLAYGNAVLTSANDAHALRVALRASHDAIGLHTTAQRASFGAANTYIADLANQATQAYKSGHGVDAAMGAIRRGLPLLDSAKTKNRQYWQEVQTLVGWLDKLRASKPINLHETLTGKGLWSLTQVGGKLAGPLGRAAGWRVPGFGGGDRWPALLEGGEAVVPKHLTPAVAPFLRAHGVPGFSTGLVPSYTGPVAGLPPWDRHNQAAFTSAFAAAMATAMQAGIKSARSAALTFGVTSGATGGDALANQALARRLFPWPASQWGAFVSLVMAESGFNRFARNPSSGAYGIPQALPPTKLPFAGQAAGGSHTGPQLSWMFDYIRGRYGTPAGAWAHELSSHWYDAGGWLPPGLSLAYNGTGRPELVGGAMSGADVRELSELLRQQNSLLAAIAGGVQATPGGVGRAVVDAMNGIVRPAGLRGLTTPAW